MKVCVIQPYYSLSSADTDYCYSEMFTACWALTTAPVLSATTLANNCYKGMFSSCVSLSAITCYATDISANSCTDNWVSGVSASGTFHKAANICDWIWKMSGSGIPSGWTVDPDDCGGE